MVGTDLYIDPWSSASIQASIAACAAMQGCHALFTQGAYTVALSLPAGALLYGGYGPTYRTRNVNLVSTSDQSTALTFGSSGFTPFLTPPSASRGRWERCHSRGSA